MMDDIDSSTFTFGPSTNAAARQLVRQLNTFRNDLAELTVSTEIAANRIASVLHQLRSRADMSLLRSNDPSFQSFKLATALPNLSFSGCCYHSCSHLVPSTPVNSRSSNNNESVCFPGFDQWSTHQQHATTATAIKTSSMTPDGHYRPTNEQSRMFLSVISSFKEEHMETHQCQAVEVRSWYDTCQSLGAVLTPSY